MAIVTTDEEMQNAYYALERARSAYYFDRNNQYKLNSVINAEIEFRNKMDAYAGSLPI